MRVGVRTRFHNADLESRNPIREFGYEVQHIDVHLVIDIQIYAHERASAELLALEQKRGHMWKQMLESR
jgi:hypothetical protein